LVESSLRKSNIVPELSHVSVFDEGAVVLTWRNENGWSTKKQHLIFGYKRVTIEIPKVDGALGHLKLIT